MTRNRRGAMAVLAAVALCGALVACDPTYPVKRTEVDLAIPCNGTTTVKADWLIPQDVTPTGLIWLQHGFARSKGNVVDVAQTVAARGWIVVSPSLSGFGSCAINTTAVQGGIASLIAGSTGAGSALEASYDAARAKVGVGPANLPANVALVGHSAGGALATVVGGTLASNASATVRDRLKGIVLLDPVENADGGMAGALPKLTGKKVLTISGPDSSCNANSSGTKALLPTRTGFAGVRLPSGCHCDAEAGSTDGTCTIVCGSPKAANVSALKELAADWVSDMLAGKTTADSYPGGAYYDKTRTAGTIQTLTGTA